ncbi:MAG: glycosyltransferase family 39 protein [Anaerolineae bacterium]|nr:glycosyltransferase family 39 protein [Anaerolineae bacterium]
MLRLIAFARDNTFPIALFAVLRVWTLVWASVAGALVLPSAEATKHYYGIEPLKDAVLAPWQRWDTIWYSKIALEGYAADERIVFAPLYPLLMRLVSPLTGNQVVAAGLLISSIAVLTSFILLYRLGREMFDESAARRTLLFLAAFPTAFYLFAAYTDALYLALALGSYLCARGKRWEWTGVLGGLAALTRPQGGVLVAALAVEFYLQYRRREISLYRSWPLLLVILGSVIHLAWVTVQFGTPAVWMQAQTTWHRGVLPWEALFATLRVVIAAPSLFDAGISFFNSFAALLLLSGTVWSARRLPLSMTVYMAAIALPPLFVITTYSAHYPLTATSRYVLMAFPLFLLVGAQHRSWWQLPALAGSFLLQTVWMMLFVGWVFVH